MESTHTHTHYVIESLAGRESALGADIQTVALYRQTNAQSGKLERKTHARSSTAVSPASSQPLSSQSLQEEVSEAARERERNGNAKGSSYQNHTSRPANLLSLSLSHCTPKDVYPAFVVLGLVCACCFCYCLAFALPDSSNSLFLSTNSPVECCCRSQA